MKKILMIVFIIGFVSVGTSFADEFVGGDLTVVDMTIYESEPCATEGCGENIRACEVFFNFLTDNGQRYFLFGEAYGTQLNLALWKAALDRVTVDAYLRYTIIPLFIDIVWVSWPSASSPG